ncbi:MAG: phosphatase PAP2 family protein, partial [Sporichthyaceae bacterium]
MPRSASSWMFFRASRAAVSGTRPNPLRETLLLTSLFLVYRFGRALISSHVHAAMMNATGVWEMERFLRFPNEMLFQQWALRWPDVVEAANWYYVGVHFPITALFLAWGWWRRPPSDYLWARRLIITMTG